MEGNLSLIKLKTQMAVKGGQMLVLIVRGLTVQGAKAQFVDGVFRLDGAHSPLRCQVAALLHLCHATGQCALEMKQPH
jgi:hypothetical protein